MAERRRRKKKERGAVGVVLGIADPFEVARVLVDRINAGWEDGQVVRVPGMPFPFSREEAGEFVEELLDRVEVHLDEHGSKPSP